MSEFVVVDSVHAFRFKRRSHFVDCVHTTMMASIYLGHGRRIKVFCFFSSEKKDFLFLLNA